MQTTVYAIESYEISDFQDFAPLYDEDTQLHVECVATGNAVRNDYGVSGSPVWYEIDDIQIDEYEINGVAYTHKDLTAKFGADLADKLHEICANRAAEKDDWE
jgi:hypothetical protein